MAKEERYQGWKNYETWNLALWLSNDQGLYDMVRGWARKIRDPYKLADEIESFIEESNPLKDTADVYTDLLSAALGEVDYVEVAKSYLEEDDDEEDDEDEEEEEEEGDEKE